MTTPNEKLRLFAPTLSNTGTLALDELEDVNAPTPSDTYVLTWDAGTSKWIAAAISGTPVPWTSGTSMPGSPATNDRVTRTDLAMDFYYDGTQWVSVQEFSAALRTYISPITAPSGDMGFAPVDAGAYVTRFIAETYVATTNSGTKYWTCTLNSYDGAGTAHALGSTFDTSADSADTYVYHTVTVGAVVTSGDTHYRADWASTGTTPGYLYGTVTVFYRLIGT